MNEYVSRRGRFYVSNETVKDKTDTVAEVLAKIKFVPTRVGFLWESNMFEMCGMSPMFEEIPADAQSPEYTFQVTVPAPGNNFNFSVKVIRKDQP